MIYKMVFCKFADHLKRVLDKMPIASLLHTYFPNMAQTDMSNTINTLNVNNVGILSFT